MKLIKYLLLLILALPITATSQTPDTTRLFDSARNREIPIATYKPENFTAGSHPPAVIFSHGYKVSGYRKKDHHPR